MALDFPLSANPGDTYSSDKKTWEWSGEAWDSIDVLVDNSVSTTRWDSTYTTVTGNSATWVGGDYDDSAIQAVSGDWNASYSIAQGITGVNNYVENTPNVHHTALIGGEGLSATGFGQDSFLGGGFNNRVESYASGIIGGEDNITSGDNSFLAGGNSNVCDGYGSTIIGSNGANIDNVNNSAMISTAGGAISGSANESIIIGGENNIIHQTGSIAAIVGGDRCEINKQYGIASGRKAIVNHSGARVFADGSDTVFTSISADEFAIQASGLRLDDGNQASGRVLTCDLSGTGTWQDIPAGGYDDSALQAASGNWNTAYGWGDHATEGYLTSETSHADVVVDGDFSSNGLLKRTALGSYTSITDNSSNWNTAFGWGDHASAGYLTSETSHADVVVDGDFSSNGLLKRTALGSYTSITDNSSNWNAAHSTVQAQSGNWSSSGSTRTFLAIGGVEDTGPTSNTTVTMLSSASLVSSNVKNDRCWDSHSNTVHTTDWSGVFTGYDNFRSAGPTPIKTEIKINNPDATEGGSSSTNEGWIDVKVVVDWENGNVIGTVLYSSGNVANDNSIYVLSTTLLTGDNLYAFTRLPVTDTGDGHTIPGIRIHKESYKITAFPRTELTGSERDNTIGIELVEVY